ncbi:MAG: dihydropyrimidinase [Anaerolineales bacterium]
MLIQNATLITASETLFADVLIEGEKIAAILPPGSPVPPATQVMDARGLLLLPGGVDPHVHLDLPMFDTVSSDDHYTGHKAAAFGGTTTVMDFIPLAAPPLPLGVPVGNDKGKGEGIFQTSLAQWRAKAQKAAIDYSFHMNLTAWNPQIAAELPALLEAGINTLKVFTAYNNRLRLDDRSIFEAMQHASRLGMLVMAHCENGDVIETLTAQALAAGHTAPEWHAHTRPAWGAVEATLRMCAMAAQADAPTYIVHMNAGGEVDLLRYAKERGAPVFGETCPQYLFFTQEHLRRPDGAKWICSPPMRTPADNARLWEGVQHGILDTIGTDHCPFFYDGTQPMVYEGKPVAIPGKELGREDFTKIPNGLPGIQDRLPILWTEGVGKGRMTPNQFVALTATNPAKIFGLYPRKGTIMPGSDADLVLWDPQKRVCYGVAHSQQRTDYNLYEGWELQGYPVKVFLRGNLIVDDGKWLGRAGMGQFLPRSKFDRALNGV